MLRDMHTENSGRGLAVAGVSPQSPERHRNSAKIQIPFTSVRREKFVIKMYDLNGPWAWGEARNLSDRPGAGDSPAVLADFASANTRIRPEATL